MYIVYCRHVYCRVIYGILHHHPMTFLKLGIYECVIVLNTRSAIDSAGFRCLKIWLDANYFMFSSYITECLIRFLFFNERNR